jgi:V/A-type H+-transporting ATPase subunit K
MYVIVFLAVAISILTAAAGFYMYKKGDGAVTAAAGKAIKYSVGLYSALVAVFLFFLMPEQARAASAGNPQAGMGFLAAALSTGLATIGAGYAVGAVGSSALGAVSEDPKILGKTLIYVGLAEGIAIYGLIVSIMILGNL